MILLLDTRNDKHYVGLTTTAAVAATGLLSIDTAARTATLRVAGAKHVFSYTSDYDGMDLVNQACADAASFLVRNAGWIKFTSQD